MEKKILLTGADGFIGSHLLEELVINGYKVKAFCYYNSFNTWGWLDTLPKSILNEVEIFTGDIRDPNGVKTAMRDCYKVFHLAALIGIPFSYHSPDSYIDTNIKGTLNVLQSAKDFNIERILVTSTSEVYGTAQYVPMDEKHPRQPQSPYSASKIGADSLAESFFRSFELPVTIVRPFNTYGPRQSARAIIPTIITQLLSGRTEIYLGDLSPTRDLLFVKDTVKAFLEIGNCPELIGEDCNISTNSEISIGDLVNLVKGIINPSVEILTDVERIRPEKSEVFRLFGDNSKILKYTGWRPSVSINEGLKMTIDWFSNIENLKLFKADIYNV